MPMVELPAAATNMLAILLPRPVFSNALAKKKENTMSQMDSLVKPDMAVWKLQVLVASSAVRQQMDQPPIGSGSKMSPDTVQVKMLSSVHACASTPAGIRARTARPMPMHASALVSLKPWGREAGTALPFQMGEVWPEGSATVGEAGARGMGGWTSGSRATMLFARVLSSTGLGGDRVVLTTVSCVSSMSIVLMAALGEQG
mmetsp:Transcript_692/g.1745  ORF Transcript_692/g.1745 Transcript_692/m.1745 type:complete len:201 (-) Transcript_692:421-1023(-)